MMTTEYGTGLLLYILCVMCTCRLYCDNTRHIYSMLYSPLPATLAAALFHCWWSSRRCTSCRNILVTCRSSLCYSGKCSEKCWCRRFFIL